MKFVNVVSVIIAFLIENISKQDLLQLVQAIKDNKTNKNKEKTKNEPRKHTQHK